MGLLPPRCCISRRVRWAHFPTTASCFISLMPLLLRCWWGPPGAGVASLHHALRTSLSRPRTSAYSRASSILTLMRPGVLRLIGLKISFSSPVTATAALGVLHGSLNTLAAARILTGTWISPQHSGLCAGYSVSCSSAPFVIGTGPCSRHVVGCV